MGAKRYVNRAKSGATVLPAKLRRIAGAAKTSRSPLTGPRTRSPKRVSRQPRILPLAAEETFARAVEGLSEGGWFTCAGFLPPTLAAALSDEARALWERDAFRPAGVGRGGNWRVVPDVRGDWLHWLDPDAPTPPQRAFRERMEAFRLFLNRELCLPLRDLELQYTVYPPGTRYGRHVDQLQGVRARLITVMLYLNARWRPGDGGHLRLYANGDASEPAAHIAPVRNTFLCFRSDRIPHEVLPPARPRFSLGGWFRVRPEISLPGSVPRRV